MNQAETYKLKRAKAPSHFAGHEFKRSITADLSAAAGISELNERDPVYELTESFRTQFDSCGRAGAENLAGQAVTAAAYRPPDNGNTPAQSTSRKRSSLSPDFPGYEHSPDQLREGLFFRRFAEAAFNNGRLAGAVLQGGGETMFVSCLQRVGGLTLKPNDKQKTLSSVSAATVPVQNFAAQFQFNRWVHGAAGLVIDSLMNADRLLVLLEKLASDEMANLLEGNEVDTYRRMFPFLSLQKEQELLASYKAALDRLSGGAAAQDAQSIDKRLVLTQGAQKLRSIIERKKQMKTLFLVKLREMLKASAQARERFSSPEFEYEAAQAVSPAPEPDDGDGTKKDNVRDNPPSIIKDQEKS